MIDGKPEIREQAQVKNSNLFYKVGLRTLTQKRIEMCAPQNEEDKNAYLNGINDVKKFEKDKLAEIRELDNARQTQAPAVQAPAALTQPVRTPPARTSGGMGMG